MAHLRTIPCTAVRVDRHHVALGAEALDPRVHESVRSPHGAGDRAADRERAALLFVLPTRAGADGDVRDALLSRRSPHPVPGRAAPSTTVAPPRGAAPSTPVARREALPPPAPVGRAGIGGMTDVPDHAPRP
ncbi:hypothetical protein SUDANB37_00621 [Streptomyces sp. enrichment culture]